MLQVPCRIAVRRLSALRGLYAHAWSGTCAGAANNRKVPQSSRSPVDPIRPLCGTFRSFAANAAPTPAPSRKSLRRAQSCRSQQVRTQPYLLSKRTFIQAYATEARQLAFRANFNFQQIKHTIFWDCKRLLNWLFSSSVYHNRFHLIYYTDEYLFISSK